MKFFVIFFTVFISLFPAVFFPAAVQAAGTAQDVVHTINYQGFLQQEDTESPTNGTFSMHFFIHDDVQQPPFYADDGRSLWEEYYERVTVKDGLFTQRLGVFKPLTSDIFRRDINLQMSILIVPYGTAPGSGSWFGPMSIDGSAYSVSSVGVRGEDTKEGTLTITPSPNQVDNYQALLELRDDLPTLSGSNNKYKFHIELDPYLNPFESASQDTVGLRIRYPEKVNDQDFFAADLYPTSLSGYVPYSSQPLFPVAETVPDLALYIANGTIRMDGKLSISPLSIQMSQVMPGNLEADRANVTGDIRVNEVRTEGIIRGAKLEYCFSEREDCGINLPRSLNPYVDHVIDPWPSNDSGGTKINALQIGGQGYQRGELRVFGPQDTKSTPYIEAGTATVVTPGLISPFPSSESGSQYELKPDGVSTIDSLLLLSLVGNSTNLESGTEDRAVRSLMDPYSMFNLISSAPYCMRNGRAQMALREDYCLPSPRNAYRNESSMDPDDKYYGIDPCQGIPNSELYGLPSECFADHDVPARYIHPNMDAKKSIYIIHNHTHRIIENATAEMLIDIINRSSSHVYLRKHVLPTDSVDLTLPNTLFGVNIFADVYTRGSVMASRGEVEVYLQGSDEPSVRDNITVGTEQLNIDGVSFVNDYYNDERYLDLHAKSALFSSAEFGRNAQVEGNVSVYSLIGGGSGDFHYLSMEAGNKSTQYFYHAGNVEVKEDLYFDPVTPLEERLLEGFSFTTAGRYIDADDSSFSIAPNQLSKLRRLDIFGEMTLNKNATVEGDVTIGSDAESQDGFLHSYSELVSGGDMYATTFADLDKPEYYVSPAGNSRLLDIEIVGKIEVDGLLTAAQDLIIDSALTVGQDLLLEKDLLPATGADIELRSQAILHPNKVVFNYLIDPDDASRLYDLELYGNFAVEGNADLSGSVVHQGYGLMGNDMRAQRRFYARRLYDYDNFGYYIDPVSLSRLESLTMTYHLSNALSTLVENDMDIWQNLDGNASLEVYENTTVVKDLIFRQGFSLIPEGKTTAVFRVDEHGAVFASSLAIDKDMFVADMVINGDLIVSGPSVEINANTAMDNLSISTNIMNFVRGYAAAYPETAVLFDTDGNLFSFADITYGGDLYFADGIVFTDDGNKMQLISPAGGPSSLLIGTAADKNLRLSGLSADSLLVSTAEYRLFVDKDTLANLDPLDPYDTIDEVLHRFVDPDAHSVIDSLYISDSLRTEEGITAPYLLDLENLYVTDPDAESRFDSLELLAHSTAEHLHTAFVHIDSEFQTTNTTIMAMGTFSNTVLSVIKNEAVTVTGTTTLSDSFLHIKNNDGLHIADDFSAGSGVLLTPGDLSTLITYENADYLHRHEVLGGVHSYDFARRDIDNLIPDSEAASKAQSWFRAFHGQNFFTGDGQVISLRPDLHNGTYPLLAVLPYTGSVPFETYTSDTPLFAVMASGVVSAAIFRGGGEGVSNISGHGTGNIAIVGASIGADKIVDNSLSGEIFATNIIVSSHIAGGSLQGYHIRAAAIEQDHIMPGQIISGLISEGVVEASFIQDGEIDGSRIADGSVYQHHILTDTVSGAKISLSTLVGEHFFPQAISTAKVLDGSIAYRHVSTGAVNSGKIFDLSLTGREFAPDIITAEKIQDYAVINSRFREKTLTDSDFATASVTAIKIDTESIVGPNFETDTITAVSLAEDSIDFNKFLAESILSIDIDTDAIEPIVLSTRSKIANNAVIGNKIADRVILGDFFFAENLLLSHLQSSAVSSIHFDLGSVQNEDIESFTLTGEKIQKQSIVTTQIADDAVLSAKIAEKTFHRDSITAGTLTSLSFADAAITSAKIAANTVLSTHIADFTLLDADFAENALVRSKWQSGTIDTIKIATGAITNIKFSDGTISNSKILAANITTAAIESYQIQSRHLEDLQLITDKFADNSLETIDFTDEIFDERVIAPASIFSTNIIDLSITSSLIPTEILTGTKLAADAVISDKIMDQQLSTGKFQELTLTSFHFAADSIESQHIATEAVSARVIGSRQILTTHFLDENIQDGHIASGVIDDRIIDTDAIISQHIITHSLKGDDFGLAQLFDAHFATGAVTLEHIVNLSIVNDRWLTHTLEERHVKPSSLTSDSLIDENITSSKIALATVSGQHIELLSLTDRELSPMVLTKNVLGPDSIASPNVKDNTLMAEDFAPSSVHSWHIALTTALSGHFADNAILTTHFADFTVGADIIGSGQVTGDKIIEKSVVSRGLFALADAPALPGDKLKIAQGQEGELFLISADASDAGIYHLNSITEGIIAKRHDFSGEAPVKSFNSGKKTWFSAGKELYYTCCHGHNFFLLKSFSENIQDFYFEDELYGILTTESMAWYTKDGGRTFRELFAATGGLLHRKVFSLDGLNHCWIASKAGADLEISYIPDTDEAQKVSKIVMAFQADGGFAFRMNDVDSGWLVDSNNLFSTTDNWETSTGFIHNAMSGTVLSAVINSTEAFLVQDNGELLVRDLGDTGVQSVTAFPAFADPVIEVLDVSFYGEASWYLLYRHNGGTDVFLARTTDGGLSYTDIRALGTADDVERQPTRFHVNTNFISFVRGHQAFSADADGENWTGSDIIAPLNLLSDFVITEGGDVYVVTESGVDYKIYHHDGAVWNERSNLGNKKGLLVLNDDDNGFALLQQNGGVADIFGSNDNFATTHVQGSGVNISSVKRVSGGAVFAGDNGKYGLVTDTLSPDVSTTILTDTVDLSAINPDDNGGYWFGSTTGDVYHITDFDAPYTGENIISLPVPEGDGTLFNAVGISDGEQGVAAWTFDAVDHELLFDFNAHNRQDVGLVRIHTLGADVNTRLNIEGSHDASDFTTIASDLQLDQVGRHEFYITPEMPFRIYRLVISTAPGAAQSISEVEFYAKSLLSVPLVSLGGQIDDICALNQHVAAVVGDGITRITHDGGRSFQEFLPTDYSALHFTSCIFNADGSLFLGTPDSPWLVYRLGEGIDEAKLASSSIDSSEIDTGEGGFVSTHFLPSTLTGDKLADDSLSGIHFTTHTILSRSIAVDALETDSIRDAQITTRIIDDEQITWDKIAYKTIDASSKLRENILTAGDFQDFAGVDYDNIMTDSIDARLFSTTETEQLINRNFADGVMLTNRLIQNSFAGDRLTDKAVQANHIHPDSIDGFSFASSVISSDFLASGQLSLHRILAATLTDSVFTAGAVTGGNVAKYEYWNDKIKTKSISTADLEDQSFDGDLFKARIFAGGVIGDNSILYTNIMADSLENRHFATDTNAIRGEKFKEGTITADKIVEGAISTAALTDDSITAEHIKTGVILSSKLHSQSISGIHLEDATLENRHLMTGVFENKHLQAGNLTVSKINTAVLTDSLFYDLETGGFADGAFSNKGGRFYFQNSTHNWGVKTKNQTEKNLVELGGAITAPRFSRDGSKVAFIYDNRIYWADAYFENIIDTGLSKADITTQYFAWHPSGNGFYYVAKEAGNFHVRFWNIHDKVASDSTDVGSPFDKLVFSEDKAVIGRLNGTNVAILGDVSCGDSGFSDLDISSDGTYLVGVSGGKVGICARPGSFTLHIHTSAAEKVFVDPADNDRFYFIASDKLYSSPFVTFAPEYEYDLPADYNSDAVTLFPSHILKDETVDGALFASDSIDSSLLSSLSFSLSAFNSPVITNSHLLAESIDSEHIKSDTLTASQFALAAVTAENLADETLSGEYFTANSILSAAVLDQELRMYHLYYDDPQIEERHLAAASISSVKVADRNILTTHLADLLIDDQAFIADSVVSSDSLSDSAISSFHIADRQILTTHVQDHSLIPDHFASESIGAEHLKTAILTYEHFAAGVISNDKIQDDAIRTGDGYFVTAESDGLYRYDFDGANRTKVQDGTEWDNVQRTVHGNYVAARSSALSSEISVVDIFTTDSDPVRIFSAGGEVSALPDLYENTSFIISANMKLQEVDEDGVIVSEVDTNVSTTGFDVFVSDSAYRIAYATDGGLTLYDRLSDTKERLWGGDGDKIISPKFSSDGERIIFLYDDVTQDIYAKNISSPGAVDATIISDFASEYGEFVALRPALEDNSDLFFAVTTGIYRYSNSEATLVTAVTDLRSFDVHLYSPFASGTLADKLAASAITESVWASRVLSGDNFADSAVTSTLLRDDDFTATVLVDGALTAAKLSGAIAEDRIADGELSSAAIVDGSLDNAHIAALTVESRSFVAGTLTSSYLSGELSGSVIKTGTISGDRFVEDSITGAEVADGVISGADFAANEINSFLVKDGTFLPEHFSTGTFSAQSLFETAAITGGHIADGQVTTDLIKLSDLTADRLSDGVIATEHIKSGTIESARIQNGTIDSDLFAAATIDADTKVAEKNILTANIATVTLTGNRFESDLPDSKIASATLTSGKLQTGSFTADRFVNKLFSGGTDGHIMVNELTNDKFAPGAFTAALVVNDSIPGAAVAAQAVTSAKIKPLSFTNSHFADGVFTTRTLDLLLEQTHFAAGAVTADKFVETFVNGFNTEDSAITAAKLSGEIVTGSGDGLRLSENIIMARHIATGINGSALSVNLLTAAAQFSTASRIDTDIIADDLLDDNSLSAANFLTGGHFINYAFTNDKVTDGLIPSANLQNDFTIDDITEITGAEVADNSLTAAKMADGTLLTANLASDFTTAKIGDVGLDDIATGAFQADNVKEGELTASEISDTVKFTAASFTNSIVVSGDRTERINASLTLAKFDRSVVDSDLQKIFEFKNAEGLHSHDLSSQSLVCPANYTAIVDGGSGFCISDTAVASAAYSAQAAGAEFTKVDKNVRGYICTAEQLWRARKEGHTITDSSLTAQFTIQQSGFGAELKIIRPNALDPANGGFNTLTFSDNTGGVYHCF